MSVIQSRKAQNIHIQKEFPGCLGRMVNLFDLNSGVAGNKLLTDKPHCDGASLSRSQSDVARISNAPFADEIEDKMVVSELKKNSSSKKVNGTPMKTLLAQEMSKDIESKHNPPNVVAKLMGLDSFPRQQPSSVAQRSHSKGYSQHTLSDSSIEIECWEEDPVFVDNRKHGEAQQCIERDECKDVFEIWQRSQKAGFPKNSSMKKASIKENMNEKKMALIRQKFMEAKSLSTDEKLRQSKEYQDALEVLSSNQDLLVRFLQEPNSLFSQHLYDLQSIPPPPETKKITVLKPSKMVDDEKLAGSRKNSDKQVKRPVQVVSGWEKNSPGFSPPHANQKLHEHTAQSTRIVILKPSSGKTHNVKAVISKPSSPMRIPDSEDFYVEPKEDDVRESSEVAEEMTIECENEVGHRRDETLLSSVFSNGYIGDESSFNRSENEYTPENLSDSETVSPTSRHSWDYIHKFGSPYSSSSFSRVSCSPESSVCREAKKRLSERWAMMSLNGNSQEQRHVRRSSSTLGEMLALSDLKKSARPEDEDLVKEEEPRGSTSFLINMNKEEAAGDSPRNLMRSKSVPVSSTAYGERLNVEVSGTEPSKLVVPKDLTRTKSAKSSLKGKVSSLFFSRSKKSGKDHCSSSQSEAAKIPFSVGCIPGKVSDDTSECVNSGGFGECFSPVLRGSSSRTSSSFLNAMGHNRGSVSEEAKLSVAKPMKPEHAGENLDQPSPISVLEPPFEDYDNSVLDSNSNKPILRAETPLKSNLIDKSPPIESIARTLSWDDSFAETATSYPLKPTPVFPGVGEDQRDWRSFVQALLSEVGLDGEVQSDTFFTRWHSPESPLDPMLRDKYASLPDGQQPLLPEAKRRQWRSNKKLIFDCVNATLMETTGYHGLVSDRKGRSRNTEGVVDHVWAHLDEWYAGVEVMRCWDWGEDDGGGGDRGEGSSLVVESVVRKEVVGKVWGEQMRVEVDDLGKEIEVKLLEELVDEAVVDLTGILL